jgi:hypothetical protein
VASSVFFCELSYFIVVGMNLVGALCATDTLAGVLLPSVPQVVSSRGGLMIETFAEWTFAIAQRESLPNLMADETVPPGLPARRAWKEQHPQGRGKSDHCGLTQVFCRHALPLAPRVAHSRSGLLRESGFKSMPA